MTRAEALAQLRSDQDVMQAVEEEEYGRALAHLRYALTDEHRDKVYDLLDVLEIDVVDYSAPALLAALEEAIDGTFCEEDEEEDCAMDGDHASALASAGMSDEPIGYECGEWL